MSILCPTCGCNYLPEGLRQAREHFEGLPECSRDAIDRLLTGYQLYSLSDLGRGWCGILHDVLETLSAPVARAFDEHGERAVRAALGLDRDEDDGGGE